MEQRISRRHAMNAALPQLPARRSAHGFTLIELMAVMVIIATLMAVSIPALSSLLESNNLTRGGQLVADQIGLARQIAAAKNKVVEIRLIKTDTTFTNGYNSLQLWSLDASGALHSIGQLTALPKGIVISDQPLVSAAFAATNGLSGANTMPANIGSASNAKYASFQIRPSGNMTPTLPMTNATLTIVSSKFATNVSLPKNYVTIQVNPLTSTPLVYRP